jgi:hypothetical protein
MQAAPRSGRQEDSRRGWAAPGRRLVAAVLLLAGTAGGAGAQAQPGTLTLDSIGVTGNQRNTTPAIIAASGLVLNQPLNYRQVQRAIRALFQTGQFDDVAVEQLDVDGRTVLVFQVRERPLLERWVIRGAEQIDPNTIRGRVNVPEGRPIDRAANHQYPDGLVLFAGTMFAPIEDRDKPGEGFTHKVGDLVTIACPELGTLANRVAYCDEIPPWEFGAGALMKNLASRRLLAG